MVRVYAINVNAFPDPKEYPELLEGIGNTRKEKILCYRKLQDRKLSLGAGLLLKKIFKENGTPIDEITYGANGKPETDSFYFNLSHSLGVAICAVGKKRVGCDIEQITEYKDRVIERFFTEHEIEYLQSYNSEQRRSEFFRLWTMKESYMKMTGEGMSLSSKAFEFRFENSIEVYRDARKCSCYVKEYHLPGYKVSVCSEDDMFADHMEVIV